MKRLVLVLLLLTAPALAQTSPPAPEDLDKGLSLMEQGAQLLLRHLMTQVEPSLHDMTEALKQAQPKLMEILAMIDDIKNYHPPELLDNGDILIRRKTPAELQLEAPKTDETEL